MVGNLKLTMLNDFDLKLDDTELGCLCLWWSWVVKKYLLSKVNMTLTKQNFALISSCVLQELQFYHFKSSIHELLRSLSLNPDIRYSHCHILLQKIPDPSLHPGGLYLTAIAPQLRIAPTAHCTTLQHRSEGPSRSLQPHRRQNGAPVVPQDVGRRRTMAAAPGDHWAIGTPGKSGVIGKTWNFSARKSKIVWLNVSKTSPFSMSCAESTCKNWWAF